MTRSFTPGGEGWPQPSIMLSSSVWASLLSSTGAKACGFGMLVKRMDIIVRLDKATRDPNCPDAPCTQKGGVEVEIYRVTLITSTPVKGWVGKLSAFNGRLAFEKQ